MPGKDSSKLPLRESIVEFLRNLKRYPPALETQRPVSPGEMKGEAHQSCPPWQSKSVYILLGQVNIVEDIEDIFKIWKILKTISLTHLLQGTGVLKEIHLAHCQVSISEEPA